MKSNNVKRLEKIEAASSAIAKRTGHRRLRNLGIHQRLRFKDLSEEQLIQLIEPELPGVRTMSTEEIGGRCIMSSEESAYLDGLSDDEIFSLLIDDLTDKQLIDIFGDQEMQNPGSVIGKPEPELTDDSQK